MPVLSTDPPILHHNGCNYQATPWRRLQKALPPRAPAAALESSSEAKQLASSVAARDLIVVSISGSTSGSGTSASTTYTSSRSSVLSSGLGLQLLCIDDEVKLKRLERAKHLAKEFCHGDGDVGVLERWLSEMGVGWVLGLADDPTTLLRAHDQRNNLTDRWIRALNEITESIHLMSLQSRYLDLLEGRFLEESYVPGCGQLLRFFEATVLEMLPFVDLLLAAAGVSNGVEAHSEKKFQILLDVRDALSIASRDIPLCFDLDSSVEMEAQRSKLLSVLSEKEHRLDEAIWNAMEEVRTSILNYNDSDNELGIQTSQGSPDICKVTRSLVTYIQPMWDDYWRLNHIVLAAAELGSYVPNRDIINSFHLSAEQVKTDPFTTLALEMISSLEVELAKRSESFPDHSLRHIFLINNTHFIQQRLHNFFSTKYKEVLGLKIEDYIQKYLQTSWAPVMSCLYNRTPRWFRKKSALPKFDLEFEKTYTVQKLWKVPDPELRIRLREAIVEQVVPGLTGYLKDNKITSLGVTPKKRERMLLELFEG